MFKKKQFFYPYFPDLGTLLCGATLNSSLLGRHMVFIVCSHTEGLIVKQQSSLYRILFGSVMIALLILSHTCY